MLPKNLDPIKFAKQNLTLQGQLPLAICPRLQDIGDQQNNQAEINLQFGQDASRLYFIRGQLKTTVNLICQRCNCSMLYEMDISFALSPVVSEERAKNLPEAYEPVFMQDEL